MQNKNTIIVILGVIIALGVGYVAGNSNNNRNKIQGGMHMMGDGRIMGDSGMQGMMADMNAALIGKNGDEFDRAFLSEMIVHHQGAVEMAQLALKNAKHQEIKDLAAAIITAQNKEIADMQSWGKAWYGR